MGKFTSWASMRCKQMRAGCTRWAWRWSWPPWRRRSLSSWRSTFQTRWTRGSGGRGSHSLVPATDGEKTEMGVWSECFHEANSIFHTDFAKWPSFVVFRIRVVGGGRCSFRGRVRPLQGGQPGLNKHKSAVLASHPYTILQYCVRVARWTNKTFSCICPRTSDQMRKKWLVCFAAKVLLQGVGERKVDA